MAYTVVDNPTEYFNTKLYTGNGTSQSITGVGFKPDWVWIKERSGASTYHALFDAVRGVTKAIYSNDTSAETTGTAFTSFNTNGFTIGFDTTQARANDNGDTYVAWNWLGANTTVSNTSGTISSTVSANTTSGFSIVSYTGNGSSGATVGHGLGVAPKMTIIKQRNSANGWNVWHYGNNAGDPDSFGELNSTAAWYQNQGADGPYTTQPTSSLLTLTAYGQVNGNTNTYIAYCFAEVKGYSKFGSYTGNGSDDGTFVYTGFKPAFVLVKRTDSTGYWYLWDSARRTYNYNGLTLFPNDSSAESSYTPSNPVVDFLSNGFKLRGSYPETNASGGTIIYMAFAENPFVSSTGIPTTAR